jgi:hypothetical protein
MVCLGLVVTPNRVWGSDLQTRVAGGFRRALDKLSREDGVGSVYHANVAQRLAELAEQWSKQAARADGIAPTPATA